MIQGVVIAAAVIGLLVSMLIVAVLFKFYSDNEKKLSDRVYSGLSSINYFYLTEKNINEFAQIVTEITAKELGEACGGFDCYSWSANNPSYKDLRDKFESELRGKITGFPAQIGNGGSLNFAPPKIAGLEMDEGRVKISLDAQQVYKKTNSFFVNASSENGLEINKQIRYLLLARIGQKLYGNGTYVRDWNKVWINSGKFDCGGITKSIAARTQLSSRADLTGCKILDVNFDVDNIESGNSKWNSYNTNCYNIANSTDAGANAGKVEGGKIYAQIDSLLEKSLICGIDGTDGLASINDFEGTQTDSKSYSGSDDCSESRKSVSCTKEGAVMDTDWVNLDSKINNVLSKLEKTVSSVYLTGLNLDVAAAASYAKSWELNAYKTPENHYGSCEGTASGNAEAGSCSYSYDKTTSSGSCTSSCGNQQSSYSYSHIKNHHEYEWDKKHYYQYLYDCSRSGGCRSYSCCAYSCNCGKDGCSTCYQTCYSTSYSTSETWSCKYTGNYKFTLSDFEIVVKITDPTIKIVKKGTTDFENLYFAVKFKPSAPYVIGG
ncbi:hypothetical protein D4Q76_01045 [archaeon]|nr:MAG: hypothetical protein D4Q76_01045 [archaeon]